MSTTDNAPTLQNRPGLSAIAYRIGDYGSFNRRMQAHLSQQLRPEIPALSRLTTRDRDDAAIALLDAWAIVADVLTFYQERIANEGYLRTATERLSVIELVRTIGYELHPGVAASTYLAFTVDDAPGNPKTALIPQGAGIMSIPTSPDELPQTFETSEAFLAQVDWNALKPRSAKAQVITRIAESVEPVENSGGDTELTWKLQIDGEAKNGTRVYLYLQGIATQLKPGDFLLLMDGEDANATGFLLKLETVEPDAAAGYTRVSWFNGAEHSLDKPTATVEGEILTYQSPQVFAFRQKASLFGHNAPEWKDYGLLVERDVFHIDLDLSHLQPDDPTKTQEQWKGSEPIGVFNADISCLALTDQYLIAGTEGNGIFRRALDNTETQWVAVNNSLINPVAGVASLQIRSLAVDNHNSLFVGTAGGGVFCSKNYGDTWIPVPIPKTETESTLNLLDKVVHSLTTYDKGSDSYIFAGTDAGIFRHSKSVLRTGEWEPKKSGLRVYSLLTIHTNIGTAIIRWVDNPFLESDVSYQYIYLDNISGTLTPGISFSIKGITINIVEVSGSRLKIQAKLNASYIGDRIFFTSSNQIYLLAGTDNGVYCSGDAGELWQEWGLQDKANIAEKTIYSLATYEANGVIYVIAGFAEGIYRSENLRNSWTTPKSVGDGKAKVRSLKAQKKPGASNYILFAGTDEGVYYSENNGDNWNPINRDLPAKNITALLATPRAAQSRLYAATSLPLLSQRDEWLNFSIQAPNIDLDTLYPQVLPNSWAVLIDNNLVSAYQANSVREVEREDFRLTEKVTRIETDAALAELRDFINLRTTRVLIQSHCLALAPKPFTVTTRQHQIFSDPIQSDKIFLSPYTAGLEPGQKLVVSGQRMRFEVNDIGGVVVWADAKNLESVSWEPANTNLLNQSVQNLARFRLPNDNDNDNDKYLFAGTQEGVFKLALPLKSVPDKNEWQVVENNGLTNTNIQALAVLTHASTEWRLVAGTSTGIFTRNDSGSEWYPANLKDRSVRVIVAFNSYLLAGTNNGLFRSEDAGQTWELSGLSNIDVQALTVDTDLIYAGTANDGIFLSQNGSIWKQVSETRSSKASVRVRGRFVEGVPAALMAAVLQPIPAEPVRQPIEADELDATTPDSSFQEEVNVIPGVIPGIPFFFYIPLNFSFINIAGRNIRVLKIIDATTIELTEAVGSDIPEETPATINNGLINQNVTALAVVPRQDSITGTPTSRVLAGTAGSGIYYSDDYGQTWLPVPGQPADLDIRCLFADESGIILAGTAMGGVFASQNQGADWKPLVSGLAITNSQPIAVMDIQTVVIANGKLFAGGLGRLRSDDNLEQVLLEAGDQLQLLGRPVLATSSAEAEDPKTLWRWGGRDRNGFEGYLLARQDQITLYPAATTDEVVTELALVQAPPTDQQVPRLKLAEPLKNCYDPATVKICANIVPATHGETIEQILGSGDALSPNQRFELSKPPLTYVAADNPRGAKSTLEVRVNDILWREAERLYQLKERDEAYIVRLDADSNATLTFGDGEQGARLPTGQENIRAQYRHGLGIGGNLAAGSLSLLKTRPPGIKAVVNPVPATGGANPEPEATAREKAPPTVRTLGRIVSLQDFEDFAQSFAGIGKALATPIRQGGTRMVHITVAGGEGAAVIPTSSLYENLVKAIDAARDPFQVVVQVDSYEKILFNVEAKVVVNPRYKAEKVLAQVRSDLLQHFAFKQRQFGQPVTASEVIARIQRVEGVDATDLDCLYLQGKARLLEPTLTAALAQWDETTTQVSPAQLLLLNPQGLTLTPVPVL